MWIIFLTQFVLNWIERVGNSLSVYGFPNLDIPVQMPLSVWLTHSSCMTRGGEWGSQECDSLCLEAQAQISSDESQPESLLGPHWWLQLLGPDVGVTPQKSLEDVHRPDVPGDLELGSPHTPQPRTAFQPLRVRKGFQPSPLVRAEAADTWTGKCAC